MNRKDALLFTAHVLHGNPVAQALPPAVLADRVTFLFRAAAAFERYNRIMSNDRNLTDKEERKKERLRTNTTLNAKALGLEVIEFTQDPRGYPIKLKLPDGAYNTMGGEEVGWGI